MWWGGVVQRAEKMPKPQQTAPIITPSQKSDAKKTPLTPYICPDIHIFFLPFTLTFYRIVYVSWVVVQNKKKEKASSMCESISFSSSSSQKKEHKGISSHSKSCALLTSTKKKNCCKDEDFRTKILFDFSFFFFLRAGWGYSDGANRRFVLTADENLKLAFFLFHYKGFIVRRFRPHKVWFFSFETWHKKTQGILIFEQTYTNQSKSLPRILLGDDACFFRGLCRFLFFSGRVVGREVL